MPEIYFGEFRKVVKHHYNEIAAAGPAYQSVEWFLLRYLRRIEKTTNPPSSPGRVENSMRGFMRFYVDMVEEHSTLGDRCIKIYEEYRKTLRSNQES